MSIPRKLTSEEYEARKNWLEARDRMPGYDAYVQAATDWHAFDGQKAKERNWTVQSVEERDKVPEYQEYQRIKQAFDTAAKLLPEYTRYQYVKNQNKKHK